MPEVPARRADLLTRARFANGGAIRATSLAHDQLARAPAVGIGQSGAAIKVVIRAGAQKEGAELRGQSRACGPGQFT